MEWVPAVTTSAVSTLLLGSAGWLAKQVIETRLRKTVEFEFEAKAERLKAEIRAAEAHVDAVRTATLAAITQNQNAINERRLRAVESVWKATLGLKTGSMVVKIVGRLKLDNIGVPEPSVQKFAAAFAPFQKAFLEQGRSSGCAEASAAQPFVAPMAWAMYTAYESIVVQAVMQFNALQNGDDPRKFIDAERTQRIVSAALPEHASLVAEHKEAAYAELLPEIEQRLLHQLRATIEGRLFDPQDLERARRVAAVAGTPPPAG